MHDFCLGNTRCQWEEEEEQEQITNRDKGGREGEAEEKHQKPQTLQAPASVATATRTAQEAAALPTVSTKPAAAAVQETAPPESSPATVETTADGGCSNRPNYKKLL